MLYVNIIYSNLRKAKLSSLRREVKGMRALIFFERPVGDYAGKR